MFLGGEIKGYGVFSFEKILQIYPDVYIYVSPNFPIRGEIYDELINNWSISKDRILNFEEVEKTWSCISINHNITVSYDKLSICCTAGLYRNESVGVELNSKDISGSIKQFAYKRKQLLNSLQQDIDAGNKENPCLGCPSLKKTYWDKEKEIREIGIGLYWPCQLKCNYCLDKGNATFLNENRDIVEVSKNTNIVEIVEELKTQGLLAEEENICVTLAGGEVSILPKHNIMFKQLKSILSCYYIVATNAVKYDPNIVDLIKNNGHINISLDAGCAESYAKIKGLAVFENVLDNIRKYKSQGVKITLKYILLPENVNHKDLDGFCDFAEEISPQLVYISRNIYSVPTDEEYVAARYIAERMKKISLKYYIMPFWDN